MPALIGTCWENDSWTDDSWESNTWVAATLNAAKRLVRAGHEFVVRGFIRMYGSSVPSGQEQLVRSPIRRY